MGRDRKHAPMLRIRADINGHDIGALYIHNTTRRVGRRWVYDAATWDGVDGVFGVEVTHVREQSWTVLVAKVLAKVNGVKR